MRYTRLDPKKASVFLLLAFQCILGLILLGHRGCEPSLQQHVASIALLASKRVNSLSASERVNSLSDAIFVHVVGNVINPGVYKFPANSSPTRKDVVAAAGGLINPSSPTDLSIRVRDEEQVLIE